MKKDLNEAVIIPLDLETTGLNPNNGFILEVGAVIADAHTLEVKDYRSWVVRPILDITKLGPMGMVKVATIDEVRARADEYVLKMHEKNGLWEEVEASKQTLIDVGLEFPHWLHENGLRTTDQVYTMAGNGPDRFDRQWLRHSHGPLNRLDDLFHYRSLDISNIKQAYKMAGYPLTLPREGATSIHRAVPDCFMALEDWKFIRTQIRSSYE